LRSMLISYGSVISRPSSIIFEINYDFFLLLLKEQTVFRFFTRFRNDLFCRVGRQTPLTSLL